MNEYFLKLVNRFRSTKKRTQRRVAIAGYGVVLAALIGVIGLSYQSPSRTELGGTIDEQIAMQEVQRAITPGPDANSYIDQVTEADLAYSVAEVAQLSVENNVMERSVSLAAKSKMAQTDDQVISKPIVSVTEGNSALTTYTSVEGDDVDGLAAKFGVSAQTIKWANNLTGNSVAVGTTLTIPSVDGVVRTVGDADDLNALADKYGSNANQILAVNNILKLNVGEKILLPGGVLPENERPGYTSTPAVNTSTSSSSSSYYSSGLYATYAGNRYAYGYCTWYAYNRRIQMGGRAVGSFWGNATSWDEAGRSQGFLVDSIPEVGAIIQIDGGWGGAGHVAIVEEVRGDGAIRYSDMNGLAGWNRVGWSDWMFPPASWEYIH